MLDVARSGLRIVIVAPPGGIGRAPGARDHECHAFPNGKLVLIIGGLVEILDGAIAVPSDRVRAEIGAGSDLPRP